MAHQLTTPDELLDIWHDVLDQACVKEDDFYLLAVSGSPKPNEAKAAWFWPKLRVYAHDNVLTTGAARDANKPENLARHRIAIYSDFEPGDPVAEARIAAMLRHEIRHAEQWTACGRALFELDAILDEVSERAAVGSSNPKDLYYAKPIELDANRAAAQYLRDRRPDAVAGVLLLPDDTVLAREMTAPEAPSVLVERTLERLRELREFANQPQTFKPPADVAGLIAAIDPALAACWRAGTG